ncbi:flagellar assembly protein FliH [Fictibacillus nanhaiensis]|uniref:flagellar assembly protein FliH n=1 Tax=Fictibacillus nanhaiensis TaxID=742169 RepID=UPI001C984678|nr:flagellar assembly protein FliH [Fictibacillus nanhaiensis]MBY6036094.1 flagellar assembly protein FliH [Fictibacillus nanhaiensis]
MSKVIKSFNNQSNHRAPDQDVVIGIQPLTLFAQINESIPEEDDDTTIHRLKNEASTLLEEAKKEAAQLKADAEMFVQSQHEKIKAEEQEWRLKMQEEFERTKQEGFEAGFQSGVEQGHQNWKKQLDEVKSFIDKMKEDYDEVINEAEPQIILLAIKAAEKIIGRTLEDTPEVWVSIVKQLVKEAREFETVKLYVPTQWFDLTLHHREELKNMLQSTATLFIYPDESLEENGAVIEFPFGKIDATLDVQLKEIREKLIEQIEVFKHEC